MRNKTDEMIPEEIRAIREQLGLSQVEAGELLGGGPRAFTKYERGTVKPSASIIKLLRLYEADPALAATLRGRKARPMPVASRTRPFEVSGDHIVALTEQAFSPLLRRLLHAEAQAHDIPADSIHVASNIDAPDGGEDGRMVWEAGPDRTRFLSSRSNQFQLKAGKIAVVKAGRDVLTKTGAVKNMVRPFVEAGGHYQMLCAQRYVQEAVEKRRKSILKALRHAGMTVRDDQVLFRDADQIAGWANCHPAVAIWVKEQTQPGTIGPFRSWLHLAGRSEHERSPWVEDDRLPELSGHLHERVANPRGIARVVGLSGIGKTRLVLQALGHTKEGDSSLSHIVLYADASESDAAAVNGVVQVWSDMGARAIIVVDRCPPQGHDVLAGMVLRSSSRLSLITIDNEIPSGTLDKATFQLGEASPSVIEGIIDGVSPSLPSEDHRRLAQFGKGFPGIALRIGTAWMEARPIAHATDEQFVSTFVLGRAQEERELVLKSAMLLAAFRLVPAANNDQLKHIAALGRDVVAPDLGVSLQRLVDRGVAQRRGESVALQPRPIAMKLAERQWKEWSRDEWDQVLVGGETSTLRVQAARQLAFLNDTDVALKVVADVCRPGGPFDDIEEFLGPVDAEVLSLLAEVDGETVVRSIERSLATVRDLSTVRSDIRGNLVWALEKIAFRRDTFEDGARLLLRLAVAEQQQGISGNATRKFTALFPMLAGNTAADGASRLLFLEEAAETEDPIQSRIVVDALIEGTEMESVSRFVGAEAHGSRPALEDWRPATQEEATAYINGCVTRLADFAGRTIDSGIAARDGLGRHLHPLLSRGFIDTVETIVTQVGSMAGQWIEALEGLGHFLRYDVSQENQELIGRVQKLIADLQPQDFETRVRLLVTEMPWDFPCEEELDFEARQERQAEAVHALAVDIVEQPTVLESVLPEISRGQQRMAIAFGESLAKSVDSPLDWLERIVSAVVETPEDDERNFDLLSGYVAGMVLDHLNVVDTFKQRVAQSSELAPAFPLICSRVGIAASDVEMAISSLQAGLLPPWRLTQWSGTLSQVSASTVVPLFDAMLDYSVDSFVVCIDLMGKYVHDASGRLEFLRSQVRRSAENVTRWAQLPGYTMFAYHFEKIMNWILEKGRADEDASFTALTLTRALVKATERSQQRPIEPLIPTLLSRFPEIVWPLIGQAIVSDGKGAWRFEHLLGKPLSFDLKKKPPILKLPEDTLFAWCHAHPDCAPAFVATTIPVLTTYDVDSPEILLHPAMARLLREFGDRENVLQALGDNMNHFGWKGSETIYYQLHQGPLETLRNHPRPKVRQWARTTLRQLGTTIENVRAEEEERRAQWEV